MRVWAANGVQLDASYSVAPDGDLLALIMESRGGGANIAAGIAGRNSDYNETLDLLLERLKQFGVTIRDAFVDSRRTQALDVAPADRRILSRPVRLADVADVSALRFEMGRRQEQSPKTLDRARAATVRSGYGCCSRFRALDRIMPRSWLMPWQCRSPT